jgi:quercetin dioxygenase-like cupin family protein
MVIDPSHTYLNLVRDGSTRQLPGGEAFWSLPETELAAHGENWMLLEFECASDWKTWEMHPHGDEFIYLLSGDVTLQLDDGNAVTSVPVHERGAIVVPRGVWHTAKVHAPSRMLFATLGKETRHRPVT